MSGSCKTCVLTLLLTALWIVGCSAWPGWRSTPTTYVTPAQRIEAIERLSDYATGTDSVEQQQHTAQLARQIQQEADPLVREAIVRTIAKFRTPMAQRVLMAGLADEDPNVRIVCCQALGERQDTMATAQLGRVLREDSVRDVRVAATQALGQLQHSLAIAELLAALEDRDPALQYAGVQAMQQASGANLGSSVAAWREFALSQVPAGDRQAAGQAAAGGTPLGGATLR